MKMIILVMSLVPITAFACGDGEPLYPETITIDIEVNAL